MEIAKKPSIEKVSFAYRPYIEALLTDSIRDKNRPVNLAAIQNAIVLATEYNRVGSNPEDEKTNRFLSEGLYNEIMVKFPYVRHGEIALAIKKGVLGEYAHKFPKDKFIGINVATLYQFVKFYLESDDRKKALEEWNKVLDEENGIVRSEKPVANIFELDEKAILSLYNDYLSSGEVPLYSRVYYDAICKIKGVKTLLTKEDKLEIEKKAQHFYESDLKQKKVHLKEPDTYQRLINSFDRQSQTFAGIAKRFALKSYFDKCKLNNVTPV